MSRALIVVDVQNDFVTGSLAVPNAKEIIPIIRWVVDNVKYARTVGTFDWHPENHISFKQWPIHCVQYSDGAKSAIYPLAIYPLENKLNLLVYKGQDINMDSYSAFFDNDHETETGLDSRLKGLKIDELDIVGLATDYCVKFTAIDAAKLGYKTNVLSFACKGITPETTKAAIEEMKDNHINIL